MAGNFLASRTYIYISGNVIQPSQNNTNENTIYNQHNASLNNVTGHQHTGAIGDGATLTGASFPSTFTFSGLVLFNNAPQMAPIGSLIPFQDFNGLVTFNTTYWKMSDGTVISQAGPLNGQTTEDVSGRYLVGFGTDGGGNIGTAPWATGAVGNAGNTINLQHAHTVSSHTHDLGNHTHTGPSHTHTVTSHSHSILEYVHGHGGYTPNLSTAGTIADVNYVVLNGSGSWVNVDTAPYTHITLDDNFAPRRQGQHAHDINNDNHNHTGATGLTAPTTDASGTGATGTPSTNTSGSTSPSTDNQLSTTQSIQPRSIRVRAILRVA